MKKNSELGYFNVHFDQDLTFLKDSTTFVYVEGGL